MVPIKKLILHVGVPKTASSLIQKSLRALRRDLRLRRIAYVDRKEFLSMPNYRAWAAYDREKFSKPAFFDELAAAVASRRRAALLSSTLIISNEAISGRLWPEYGDPFWSRAGGAIAELVSVLRPRETQVFVYVRRQDRLLEALYLQRMHLGFNVEWPEFRDRTCVDERVRYSDLLDTITAAPTVVSVTVRPFELIGAGAPAFVEDFLSGLGLAHLVHRVPAEYLTVTNPSYTQPAWESALTMNPLATSPEQKSDIRKFLSGLFPPGSYPPAQLLTQAEREDLLARYRSQNEAFFERYLPDLPGDAYSTVDRTKALGDVLTPIRVETAPEAAPDK